MVERWRGTCGRFDGQIAYSLCFRRSGRIARRTNCMSVPITVVLGLAGVIIGGWLQRRHWLRTTREEIRVRETSEANSLIKDIAEYLDKRISTQREFLHSISDSQEARESARAEYKKAISEFGSRSNAIRSHIYFFFGYQEVLRFEKSLPEKIVINGLKCEHLFRSEKATQDRISELDLELSKISSLIFIYCGKLSRKVSAEDFGTLRKIRNWQDPNNPHITLTDLTKRLLNI